MSEVVSVRLKREVIREIDELVSLGLFSSRNEALSFIISEGLKEAEEWRRVLDRSKKVGVPLLDKPLEDFLSERDRY
ncbi:hypothetical protein HA72_1386 [Metallosphaera sedula]|uniref:Uncharacterized protein n=3 Tax=Metallosphaera TaxID=41980 RepID=A4YGJ2_METS5|nr:MULTISPECIES: ribbon-helix-helix domain-containing protein [Metallosphaera]ABP95544.1 hypothetical protein Msed_1386 [Metallosphaera sedula DSM 5348]AIM27528.1 hypothetical protein HA72_1386 [Metallosphaera sedula]AKV74393.1 hypothetical protein MsedA_1404 [Metallosphaera sedula]AKV76632.1 hypothetical protein MsedB_1406 [Metallosphaera sedula]AKV78884.1 hypothetical protein MsedC_1404 [Metallosphaera sedula]